MKLILEKQNGDWLVSTADGEDTISLLHKGKDFYRALTAFTSVAMVINIENQERTEK